MIDFSIPTFCHNSGGRSSGRLSFEMRNFPINHLFCNTGREHPATYDFLRDQNNSWGINITWLEYRDKAPFFEVVDYETADRTGYWFDKLCKKRGAVPNQFKRFCTIEMKIKTARRYIRNLGIKEYNSLIGFRADEPHRNKKGTEGKTIIEHFHYPLVDMGITSHDIGEFWKKQPFDLNLPLMPNGKTVGGNCMGCFMHSEYQHVQLLRQRPDDYAWLEMIEEKYGHTFNDKYSYKQLRKDASRQFEMFSEEEFFCHSSHGGCGI